MVTASVAVSISVAPVLAAVTMTTKGPSWTTTVEPPKPSSEVQEPVATSAPIHNAR